MGAVRAMVDVERLPMAGEGDVPTTILGLGRLLTVKEVAEYLGVRDRSVRSLPGLPWVEVAHGRFRTAESWLVSWLASKATTSSRSTVVEAGTMTGEGGASGVSS